MSEGKSEDHHAQGMVPPGSVMTHVGSASVPPPSNASLYPPTPAPALTPATPASEGSGITPQLQ